MSRSLTCLWTEDEATDGTGVLGHTENAGNVVCVKNQKMKKQHSTNTHAKKTQKTNKNILMKCVIIYSQKFGLYFYRFLIELLRLLDES